jgi:hypothetical protein
MVALPDASTTYRGTIRPKKTLARSSVRGGREMRHILILFILVLLVAQIKTSKADDEVTITPPESGAVSASSAEDSRVYPIAPGVWYPGEPLPEKPIRYYRVRCWPGCHRGSSFGKYPGEPLNMEPIFRTSTINLWPHGQTDKK